MHIIIAANIALVFYCAVLILVMSDAWWIVDILWLVVRLAIVL